MLKLPPVSTMKEGEAAMLEGMHRRQDGHA